MTLISIGETLVLFCCFEQDRQKTKDKRQTELVE